MPRLEATPNPAILIWARETAGMTADVAARKAGIKTEKLASWETGYAKPSIPQLRKLAAIYHRPLAAFYLPEAPPKFDVMHDFRRLPSNSGPAENSPTLVYEIRRAYDRREWALSLMADIEEAIPLFETTANTQEGVEQVALRLRQAIGISVDAQKRWKTGNEAFKQWRVALERVGVLTLQASKLQLNEARGFSISLKPLPVVVANIKDAPRGRIFTLIHETTHIMLNEGGICDLHDAETEAFCNRVAGAVLFPRNELLGTTVVRQHKRNDPVWTDIELRDLSREFGGSREAALVRLLTLGLTTQNYYDRFKKVLLQQYQEQQRQKEQSDSFPPPHVIAIASAGPLFTSLVVKNFNLEKITASDVSDYLGIRIKHIKELQFDSSTKEQV
jgi:Zn-dependent peptidase ImmA (M78 family)